MIIFRYLAKEVMSTVAATTVVLLLIFMSTQFVHYLSDAAIGRFSAKVLVHIMILQVPYLLGLLMPLGFYLALLTAYGRLHVDREMMVLSSSGVSERQILTMTLMMATVVALVVAVFTCWLAPYVAVAQKQLMVRARSAPLVETIMPGRFYSLDRGRHVFYIENVSRDHRQLQNIFVAQQEKPKKASSKASWSVMSAASGYQIQRDHQHQLIILNGNRYHGIPGNNAFILEHFAKLIWNLPLTTLVIPKKPQMLPTSTLLLSGNQNPKTAAELQWRLAMPLSVLILAVLAVPLSRVNPRQGRFAQLLPGVLIYIFYANMLFVSRDWIQSGSLAPQIGLWWLHGLLVLIAMAILFSRSHWKDKCFKRFSRTVSP